MNDAHEALDYAAALAINYPKNFGEAFSSVARQGILRGFIRLTQHRLKTSDSEAVESYKRLKFDKELERLRQLQAKRLVEF